MKGRNWYSDSRNAIKRQYGGDWELMCGFLAATSPKSTVKANVKLADKAYYQYKESGTVKRESFINTHHKSLLAVIAHGEPNGRKCKALYQNLLGNENYVPVDIWMLRYAGILKKAPSRNEYDLIEGNIKQEAKEMGLTPAQRQAEIWSYIRGSASGYAEALAQGRLL